jgi:hemolysin III
MSAPLELVEQDVVAQPIAGDPLGRTWREELVNALTHGVGLVLSVAGAALLIDRASAQGDAWRWTGCVVFAATLIAVYAASTLSHAISQPRLRRAFRILDQALIYLLIVGSYTPWCLAYLRGGWWWLLFVGLWTAAIAGFVSKIFYAHRVDAVGVSSYLLLAWVPILLAPAYVQVVPAGGLRWVLIGGLCYTLGTVFLVLDYRRLHFHGIWHVLVMAGSLCHYWAILLFVACPLTPA